MSQLTVKNVTAIGYESPNIPQNTIDGNLSTRWSNEGIGSWITFDLGAPFELTDVKIAWYNGNQRKNTFTISASSDGASFTSIFSGTSSGTTTNFEDYVVQAAGRFVKITFQGNTVNDWCSITEVQIDGSSAPTPTPPPTGLDVNGVDRKSVV